MEKCKVEGCKREYRAKGYCNIHYKKWRHGELPHSRYKTCNSEGCRKRVTAHGLCGEHAKVKASAAAVATTAPAATSNLPPPAADASPAS